MAKIRGFGEQLLEEIASSQFSDLTALISPPSARIAEAQTFRLGQSFVQRSDLTTIQRDLNAELG
jgi:hypothetical protein